MNLSHMKLRSACHATALLATMLIASLVSSPVKSDVVADWNAQVDVISAEKALSPPMQARTLAILHVAIFEAVNTVEPQYTPYRLKLATEPNVSAEAAAASAGYAVLLALYPDQRTDLDTVLAKALKEVPAGAPRETGIALGKRAAAGILQLRANDGSDVKETYRPYTKPGVYVPTTIPISVTVGGIKPWVMKSSAQFRPAPPPALDSATWTRDVNEIREMGARSSKRRTSEQTDIGRFWFVAGGMSYNPLVRQVVTGKALNLIDSARLFALVSLAAADSFTAVFDAKYTYNFWRPITAIRNADQSGNSATPRDASWLPLGETPMHPEYPCAHCISSSAVAAVLQALVGEPVGVITMTSSTAPGVTRKWTRLTDYKDEVSNARIWAGFHYRFSTEVAQNMGKQIAELTLSTQLLPLSAQREKLTQR